MTDGAPRLARTSLARRLRRSAFRAVPLMVWLGALAVVLLLLRQQPLAGTAPAVVEAARHSVVAPAAGIVQVLAVGVHEAVDAGQLIGRLSDDQLVLRLTRARHELSRLQAEVEAEAERLAVTAADVVQRSGVDRRLYVDREEAAIELLQARADLEEAIIRQRGVAIELERVDVLGESGVASPSALNKLQTDHDAWAQRVVDLRREVDAQRGRAEATESRVAAAEAVAGGERMAGQEVLLAPRRWQVQAQEVELEQIALERQRLALRAPVAGTVESVARLEGQFVAAGEVLVTVVARHPDAIVAYLPPAAAGVVVPDQEVGVEDPARPGAVARTTVRSVGPSVVELPARLWRRPGVPEWGLPVRLTPVDGYVAGQLMRVDWAPAAAR